MPKKISNLDQARRKSPKLSVTLSEVHHEKLKNKSVKTGKSVSSIINGILDVTPYWAE